MPRFPTPMQRRNISRPGKKPARAVRSGTTWSPIVWCPPQRASTEHDITLSAQRFTILRAFALATAFSAWLWAAFASSLVSKTSVTQVHSLAWSGNQSHLEPFEPHQPARSPRASVKNHNPINEVSIARFSSVTWSFHVRGVSRNDGRSVMHIELDFQRKHLRRKRTIV